MNNASYSLGGLANVFRDALKFQEPTLAFEVTVGRGAFVFLMFFSQEDIESRDRLFLLLRNTKVLLDFKLYGHHESGGTKVYIDSYRESAIRAELQLRSGSEPFELGRFFEQLNAGIPSSLPLRDILSKFREVWPDVKKDLAHVLDDARKSVLIGIRRLPSTHKPREKTLRKLLMYTDGAPGAIEQFIRALKLANVTLIWAVEGTKARAFADVVSDLTRVSLRHST